MEQEKAIRHISTESFLTLLSGLRKVPARSAEDVAYNNALADAYDYYIANEQNSLYPETIRQGKWVRD